MLKRIAAIVSTYFPISHADVAVTKLMKGIPTDDGLLSPRVELASLFIDQMHPQDVGHTLAFIHGVKVYQSIEHALTLGTGELAVDGVLLIGEHGDYPYNEIGQQLYPRRYFFEQICGVFGASGRSVPVFVDKGLSYCWEDALWMIKRAQALDVPLMAGSSIPVAWRRPMYDVEMGAQIDEAVVVGYGPLERYGFHLLESLQAMVERRRGGESGIKAVKYLGGDEVWRAAKAGEWSKELAEAACDAVNPEKKGAGSMEEESDPSDLHAFLLEYNDGLKATILLLNGYIREIAYAGRSGAKIDAMAFVTHDANPYCHFSYLLLNIEEMFLSGTPSYPVERTLLTTGTLDAAIRSRHEGSKRLETPHLEVTYAPPERIPWRPQNTAPTGATLDVWPPRRLRTGAGASGERKSS